MYRDEVELGGLGEDFLRQPAWKMRVLSVAMGLVLLAAAAWRSDQNVSNARQQIALRDQAQTTDLALTLLLSTLKDAETSQRGYLLTGDPSYLAPYIGARTAIASDFAVLEAEPLRDAFRSKGIARLHSLSVRKFAELDMTVRLYQRGQPAAAIALVRSNLGQQLMDQIRIEITAQQSDTDRNLENALLRDATESNWIWDGILIAAACLLLGWTAFNQVRASRNLARSADQLGRFARAFGMGLGIIRERAGLITVWSQGSERLYGYTADEAVGRLSHELLHTIFPAPLPEIEAQLSRQGFWHGELVHRRRDGTELRVQSHWALHRSNDRAGDLVIEANSDITSHARTDALLRTILEAAPALIYAKDLAGRMLLANPPTLELVGKPWAEVDGKTDMELLDNSADASVIMENDRRLMAQGIGEFLDEQVGVDATGGPRMWSSCKAPMFDGSGAVSGMVGVSFEITAKRRIEQQLRQQTIDLEHARAELEDFAHIIAHDLRAPLRALKSLAEWIEEEVAPAAKPETLEHLALMRKRADRMGMLLEALLDYSRVGHAMAPPEAVDIGVMLASIVEMLAPPLGIEVRYAGNSLTIQTARAPLVHVLQNLISNAIKHHDRSTGEIMVDVCRDDRGLVFSVKDDGPGIPSPAHARIFQIFQTLATRDSVETSGVGLSIVKKTVEAQGGEVWVESSPPARGAKFIFTWPEAGGEPIAQMLTLQAI